MTIDRDVLVKKTLEHHYSPSLKRCQCGARLPNDAPETTVGHVLDAILPEVQAQTLEDAADSYSDWETFVAADGIASTRMHGKDPDDWMRDRAAEYRKAASE